MDDDQMSRRYRMMRVGDLEIQYDLADYTPPWRAGAPATFLLYHGYARNMEFWRPWVPLLAGDFRVLRMDARGCGGTTAPPEGAAWSFDQLAGDAIGLMDALGIERVHWVGESSGGIVGLNAALKFRERLATLTLCDTPFKRDAEIASTYKLGEDDRAVAFEKYGVAGWCRKTLAYRLDTAKASPELCEWYIEQMGRTPRHVAVAMERIVGAGDFWPHLPQIKLPVLMLAGDKSPISKPAMVQEMQRRLPGSTLVALAGYGHGVNLLAPERCVAEVRKFVTGGRAAAAA